MQDTILTLKNNIKDFVEKSYRDNAKAIEIITALGALEAIDIINLLKLQFNDYEYVSFLSCVAKFSTNNTNETLLLLLDKLLDRLDNNLFNEFKNLLCENNGSPASFIEINKAVNNYSTNKLLSNLLSKFNSRYKTILAQEEIKLENEVATANLNYETIELLIKFFIRENSKNNTIAMVIISAFKKLEPSDVIELLKLRCPDCAYEAFINAVAKFSTNATNQKLICFLNRFLDKANQELLGEIKQILCHDNGSPESYITTNVKVNNRETNELLEQLISKFNAAVTVNPREEDGYKKLSALNPEKLIQLLTTSNSSPDKNHLEINFQKEIYWLYSKIYGLNRLTRGPVITPPWTQEQFNEITAHINAQNSQTIFDPFLPLLTHLFTNYLNQPMSDDPGQNKQPQINSNIQHLATNQNKKIYILDNQQTLSQRIAVTKNRTLEWDGVKVWRTNHGLAHQMRQIQYVSWVILYLRNNGSEKIKKDLAPLLNDPLFTQKLMLTMAFSSIARESEIDWHSQPAAHQYYRLQAGKIFREYYNKHQENPSTFEIFSIFQDKIEFEHFANQLVQMGSDINEDIIHIIFNICHKLDLYRCRQGEHAVQTIEDYIRRFSSAKSKWPLEQLVDKAKQCLIATGDRVQPDISFNRKYFVLLSTNLHLCALALSNQESIFAKTPETYDTELQQPFLFKSVTNRTSDDDYWYRFMLTITPSPITEREPLRKNQADFTIKLMSTDGGNPEYRVYPRSLNGHCIKENSKTLSKPQSISYANPINGFTPVIYSGDVGVRYQLAQNNFLMTRIRIYNSDSSYLGCFNATTLPNAQALLDNWKKQGILFNSLEALEASGITSKTNDVMPALSNNVHSICIFKNNLASRLKAQLWAAQLRIRLREQDEECGQTPQDRTIKISFYVPDSALTCWWYTKEQQENDLKAAKWCDQEHQNLLKKIQEVENTPSYRKKNEIKIFHLLAAQGKIDELKMMIDENESLLRMTDKFGKTALHYAAQNGHQGIVTYLLSVQESDKLPPYSSLQDIKGRTFLLLAAKYHQLNLVNTLLKNILALTLIDHVTNIETFKLLIIRATPDQRVSRCIQILEQLPADFVENKILPTYSSLLQFMQLWPSSDLQHILRIPKIISALSSVISKLDGNQLAELLISTNKTFFTYFIDNNLDNKIAAYNIDTSIKLITTTKIPSTFENIEALRRLLIHLSNKIYGKNTTYQNASYNLKLFDSNQKYTEETSAVYGANKYAQ